MSLYILYVLLFIHTACHESVKTQYSNVESESYSNASGVLNNEDTTKEPVFVKIPEPIEKTDQISQAEKVLSPADSINPASYGQSGENVRVDTAVVEVISDTSNINNPMPESLDEKSDEIIGKKEEISIDYKLWNDLLGKYVDHKGMVDYKGFSNEVTKLDAFLALLEKTDIENLDSKSLFAFWINVYNAYTIKLIVDNFPVTSIMELDHGKVWDRKWIKIGDQIYSLNDIEKRELLNKFQDPRIHFAINCAATSCPPLLNIAWDKDNLMEMLEVRADGFINDARYNSISVESIKISMIFNWYRTDFGNLVQYINKYSKVRVKSGADIQFAEYNWKLNSQ